MPEACPDRFVDFKGLIKQVSEELPKDKIIVGTKKHGIQGEQNQSLVTLVEVGFLGSLCAVEVSTPRLLYFREPDRFARLQLIVERSPPPV